MDDPRLEQAFALIRQVIADAEKRGADKMWARILEMAPDTVRQARNEAVHAPVEPEPQQPAPPAVVEQPELQEQQVETQDTGDVTPVQRRRARQGLVREIIMRELHDVPPPGLTPLELATRVRGNPASTEEERQVPDSSYRSELRAGGIAKRYVSSNGKWTIADGNAEGDPKGGDETKEEAGNLVQETLLPASDWEPERR